MPNLMLPLCTQYVLSRCRCFLQGLGLSVAAIVFSSFVYANPPELPSSSKPLRLVVPTRDIATTADAHYFYPLLNLALKKTEATDGPFITEYYPHSLSSARILTKLKNNDGMDVVWTSTSADRERDFRYVPISLLKQLSDYRVLLIRKGEQSQFDAVKNLDDLRKFKVGIGGHWPDAKLLQNNGFTIVTSIYYESLFKMLVADRFDVFPRGLFEAWDDYEQRKDMNIAIEEKLLLHYPAPFYFFVNKNNVALADRIERGLKIAIADGSFDELLLSMPAFKRGEEEFIKHNRKVFKLEPKYD